MFNFLFKRLHILYARDGSMNSSSSDILHPREKTVISSSSNILCPRDGTLKSSSPDILYPRDETLISSSPDILYPQDGIVKSSSSDILYPRDETVISSSSDTLYPRDETVKSSSSYILYPQNGTVKSSSSDIPQDGTPISSSSDILYPEDGTDRISKLPDDILLDLLLILDLKHAAQTSVLAKRWRYLWTLQTDLNLHPENTPFEDKRYLMTSISPHVYLNWVNQVVNAHRAPCINKFRFHFFHVEKSNLSNVEKWVRFALSKRVTDLDLNIFRNLQPANFSLGFDILKHPLCYNDIVNLKSLRLSTVDISGEALEFILLRCRLLEVLDVSGSDTLHTLNIVSDKLKHFTLATCVRLRELRIDAVNLISFHYNNGLLGVNVLNSTHMVFKRFPKLVDMSFEGEICRYPFPCFWQFSFLFNQLTRLAFHPTVALYPNFKSSDVHLEFDVLFPNAKQLALTVPQLDSVSILFIKFFINACPGLHELMLNVTDVVRPLRNECKKLQEVQLESETIDDMSMNGNPYSQAQEEKVIDYLVGEENGRNKTCSNLKALEFVGFSGSEGDGDVELILDVIAGANCLQTLICDPRCYTASGVRWEPEANIAETKEIRRRVRKLGKLVSRGVRVGVRDIDGLSWVSRN